MEPILVPFQYEDYRIVHIAVGIAHNSEEMQYFLYDNSCVSILCHNFATVWLSECGKTFTFGLGSTGQLGHGGTKNIPKVRLPVIFTLSVVLHHQSTHLLSKQQDSKGHNKLKWYQTLEYIIDKNK